MGSSVVVGVGNTWRHDDGIGPHIINLLQQQNFNAADLIDGGIDGLALLDKLAVYDHAIIVDAVNMNQPVGAIKEFSPTEAKLITSDALSTHGFGLAELIKLMIELDIKTRVTIIGIQPGNIAFGEGLTQEIKEQVPEIIKKISCIVHY